MKINGLFILDIVLPYMDPVKRGMSRDDFGRYNQVRRFGVSYDAAIQIPRKGSRSGSHR